MIRHPNAFWEAQRFEGEAWVHVHFATTKKAAMIHGYAYSHQELEINEGWTHKDGVRRVETRVLKRFFVDVPPPSSTITLPPWASGPEWDGWRWLSRNQSVIRFTKNRSIEITEDG
ncbi:MAG: hypothetical protein ABL962_12455, partial [Fimbriimonadaceae bacterium]